MKVKLDDKLETMLFLPISEGRKGQGGLRTQGYYKQTSEEKPLVTIITVVYNGEKFLEETILSVINQTYDNVEYIIVDGNSTDRTLNIIQNFSHAIDYWVSEKDKGIYDAMNKGIMLARGEIIGFINSDDALNPGVLSLIAEKFVVKPGFDFAYGSVDLIRNSGEKYGITQPFPQHLIKKKYLKEMPFPHPSLFVKKAVFMKVGLFDLDFPIGADYDFIIRILKEEFIGIDLNVPISRFRDGGISGGIDTYKEIKRIQKKYGVSFVFRNMIYLFSIVKFALNAFIPIRCIRMLKNLRPASRHKYTPNDI